MARCYFPHISFFAAVILLLFTSMKNSGPAIIIRQTEDFNISGDGSAANWEKTSWITLPSLDTSGEKNYETKIKLLYSATGIYCLYYCEDKKLTASMQQDFMDLWNEDVIEVFFQPDEQNPAYLEYELSPLNYELPLIVFNEKGNLNRWIPFHYEAARKPKHAVKVQGGAQKKYATVKSWTAEVFIPYTLMKPVLSTIPVSGSKWKGNLYRIDYDRKESLWAWSKNSGDFHDYTTFGDFYFE